MTKPESKINTDGDSVNVDGNAVGYHEYEYFMLNKPAVLFRQLMTIHVQQ